MATLAKLASPLNWRPAPGPRPGAKVLPRLFLFTDDARLPDPSALLPRLPRGAAVVLRHRDPRALARLARATLPRAHRLGLKVLIANDVRLALGLRADGVHLSESAARRGPLRVGFRPPGFVVTAAAHGGAHGGLGLWRAARAGADLAVLAPVFTTASHPGAPVLGPLRFARLARARRTPPPGLRVVALGGITPQTAKRLRATSAWGLAAIEGWRF